MQLFDSHSATEISKDKDFEQAIISEFLRLFRGDKRRVMQQKFTGSYGVLHKGPLNEKDIEDHITGSISASIYLLDEIAHCSTVCFDIDIPKIEIPESVEERQKKKNNEFLPIVKNLIDYIKRQYCLLDTNFLIEDTGGRGFHVWLFFKFPQIAEAVITFTNEVKAAIGIDSIEIFPSSQKHGPSGFSKSNIRLPLGIHRKYPGTSSRFLQVNTFEKVELVDTPHFLHMIEYTPESILESAINSFSLKIKSSIESDDIKPKKIINSHDRGILLGEIGDMLFLCPEISNLIARAKQESHLKHHERVALTLILIHCMGGEKRLHEIFRYCSDYSHEETQKHLDSLIGYRPISCNRLQSAEYNICSGWCCTQLKEQFLKNNNPTPLWLSNLWHNRKGLETDKSDQLLIEKVADIDNLYQSWQQAKVQSRERDIFEDILVYDAFEEHLWANLYEIRSELLSGIYKHQPFTLIEVPKSRDKNEKKRPMCWANPWDSIAALAVLNIIGPKIDSTFHDNSMGNRLAHGPKADGQIFEDWRKQNLFREVRREGFSEYGSLRYYILTDIHRYYEFIQHDKLISLLRMHIGDQKVLNIIQQYIEADWFLNGSPYAKEDSYHHGLGLPQGPALSAFLSNLYLTEIDYWLENKTIDFVRYVDDYAILCEDEKAANQIKIELDNLLKSKYGLRLSEDPGKTRGPFCATDIEPISDWIREARYELIRYSKRAETLTIFEKNEMRAALSFISGANFLKEEDIDKLIKYLGFYIATTEKLEQSDLQRAVYNLALYALNEHRPKQNATSIAIRALIKACSEFGQDAWEELYKLLVERDDDYISVVFAQEARRFLSLSEPAPVLFPKIIERLESQILSQSDIASATALTCLYYAENISTKGVDAIWQRFLGDQSHLRMLASLLLIKRQALTSTAIARIMPKDGIELNIIFFNCLPAFTAPVIDAFANQLQHLETHYRAAPGLLFASLTTASELGLKAYKNISNLQSTDSSYQLCYYIAASFINNIVKGRIADIQIPKSLDAIIKAELYSLAKILYDLGRFANVIDRLSDLEQKLSLINGDHKGTDVIDRLPVMKDVSLKDLLLSIESRLWLHKGLLSDNTEVFHEIIPVSELGPLKIDVNKFITSVKLLKDHNLLSGNQIEIIQTVDSHYIIIVSPYGRNDTLLADYIKENSGLSFYQKYEILKKVSCLIQKTQLILKDNKITPEVLPVPSAYSLSINSEGEIRFVNIGIGIAGGRKYIGLSKIYKMLPRDKWEVYSLCHLFFELTTQACSVVQKGYTSEIDQLSKTAECEAQGILFRGIIAKATATKPDSRYENINLMMEEINEWQMIESSAELANLGKPRLDRLRHFWHIEQGIKRRIYATFTNYNSFLEASIPCIEYTLDRLSEGGELEDAWLEPYIKEINYKKILYKFHISSAQLLNLSDSVLKQWVDLSSETNIQNRFTVWAWIKFASTTGELESFRRLIFFIIKSLMRDECEKFIIEVATNRKIRKFSFVIDDRYSNFKECVEKANSLILKNINEIKDRIYKILYSAEMLTAVWPLDLLVCLMVYIICFNDLEIVGDTESIIHGGPTRLVGKTRFDLGLIDNLVSFYNHDTNWFEIYKNEEKNMDDVITLLISCCQRIANIKIIKRNMTVPTLFK